jgi:hypothetical protein
VGLRKILSFKNNCRSASGDVRSLRDPSINVCPVLTSLHGSYCFLFLTNGRFLQHQDLDFSIRFDPFLCKIRVNLNAQWIMLVAVLEFVQFPFSQQDESDSVY